MLARTSHRCFLLGALAHFPARSGQYDEAYITYLHELISMMPKYGITCYIDPHQDVWSRHTGGSGAPTWTLELVGFDIYNLKTTGAAHAHNVRGYYALSFTLPASTSNADPLLTEPVFAASPRATRSATKGLALGIHQTRCCNHVHRLLGRRHLCSQASSRSVAASRRVGDTRQEGRAGGIAGVLAEEYV